MKNKEIFELVNDYYSNIDIKNIFSALNKRDYLKFCSSATYPPLLSLEEENSEINNLLLNKLENKYVSIYIHFPYCHQLCSFCHFNVNVNKNESIYLEYVELILKEVELKKNILAGRVIKSLFFGGGTPSLLNPEYLSKIIKKIKSYGADFSKSKIFLEIHPGLKSIDENYFKKLRDIGISRLNIGVQDFNDSILSKTNRGHNSLDAIRIISLAQKFNFKFNIDLMTPLPSQTLESFIDSFEIAASLKPFEITLNITSIRKEMKIYKNLSNSELPDIEQNIKINIAAQIMANQNGFKEIIPRVFTRADKRDFDYFDDPLIAFGAGAYSDLTSYFFYNELNINKYKELILNGTLPTYKSIKLSTNELMHKKMIYFARKGSLLTSNDLTMLNYFKDQLASLQKLNLISLNNNTIKLTPLGNLFKDEVAKFFMSNNIKNLILKNTNTNDSFYNHFYDL